MRIREIIKSKYSYYVLTPLLFLIFLPLSPVPTFVFGFLILVFMYITFSEGWNILGGFTGYYNFGYSAFFGIGAYTTAILLRDYGLSPFLTSILGGLIASIVAVLTGYPSLRLKGIYFALSTLPTNTVLMLVILLWPYTGGPLGITLPLHPLDPRTMEIIFYEVMLITMLATIFVVYKISRSKFGFGLVSIREDEDACRVLGVHATRLKLLAYAISVFPAAVVGGFYSYYILYIDPYTVFSMTISLYTVGLTYLGGCGTILGPIIGGITFVFLSDYLRYAVGVAYEGLHMVIFGCIITLILIFMPEGIIGHLRKKFPKLRFLI